MYRDVIVTTEDGSDITVRVERMDDLGVDEISLPRPVSDFSKITEWEVASHE